MAVIRKSFIVHGRVQGVAYRANTHRKAIQIGVTGIVRNQSDGNVYVEAQGTETQINQLNDWLLEGPMLARVDKVEAETRQLVEGEATFRVQW